MKPLPRDVKSLLEAPRTEEAVARTWVRLERSRAGARSSGRLVLALAATVLVGLVTTAVVASRRAPAKTLSTSAESVVVTPTTHDFKGETKVVAVTPTPSLATVMMQGRARRLERPLAQDSGHADVVGQLLESAVEAFVAGDAQRSAVLLSETVTHHADDPRAVEALVTLGWLQLEHLGQADQATRTLERALAQPLSQQLFDRAWPLLQKAKERSR